MKLTDESLYHLHMDSLMAAGQKKLSDEGIDAFVVGYREGAINAHSVCDVDKADAIQKAINKTSYIFYGLIAAAVAAWMIDSARAPKTIRFPASDCLLTEPEKIGYIEETPIDSIYVCDASSAMYSD